MTLVAQELPTLTDLYAPVVDDLSQVKERFDAELKSELEFVNSFCDTVRSYRGKMLRPALLLLVGRACGSTGAPHHTLGAVVEMVHMATLVHDDVLDESDRRRGEPTVASASGNTTAVLLGDYLISHAYHLCSELRSQHAARSIAATTNTVCEGELLQNRHRGDSDVSESLYFDIIRRKTAALTATACALGAWASDADESQVESLRTYGEAAGTAFQIVDDVLDLMGDPRVVGKTLGRDLAMGKLTLPTIHCMKSLEEGDRRELEEMVAGRRPVDPAWVNKLLERTGGIDYALHHARRFITEAQRSLDVLPKGDARSSLAALADFIVQRTL